MIEKDGLTNFLNGPISKNVIFLFKIFKEKVMVIIFGYEHKLSQYADDTEVITTFEENSLRTLMLTFEKFECISGLSINYDKTEILKIGSIKESKDKILQEYCFKWKSYITVLGLEIYNDLTFL